MAASSSTPCASASLPGADFLEGRLARAQRQLPSERSREVAAFVESEPLLAEARALLPLTAAGQAALPTAVGREESERLELALLLAARASYLCFPFEPASLKAWESHFNAYSAHFQFIADHRESCTATSLALCTLMRCTGLSLSPHATTASGLADLACSLLDAEEARQLDAQLQQVAARQRSPAGEPSAAASAHPPAAPALVSAAGAAAPALLGVSQLVWLIHSMAVSEAVQRCAAAAHPRRSGAPRLSAAQKAALHRLMVASASQLAVLEPSTRSYELAGTAYEVMDKHAPRVSCCRQALSLAQQEGREIAAVQAAAHVLVASAVVHANHPTQLNHAQLAAALQVYRGAGEVLQRCRKLLPEAWVQQVRKQLPDTMPLLVVVESHLEVLAELEAITPWDWTRGVALAHTALRANHQAADGMAARRRAATDRLRCSGCGEVAVGLRRCARCHKASYCSTACQHAHWPTHKRTCQTV